MAEVRGTTTIRKREDIGKKAPRRAKTASTALKRAMMAIRWLGESESIFFTGNILIDERRKS